MLCLWKLLPHKRPLFSRRTRDRVVLAQTVFEAILVLAVEQTDPACLIAQVFENAVIFLGEDPVRLLRMSARES